MKRIAIALTLLASGSSLTACGHNGPMHRAVHSNKMWLKHGQRESDCVTWERQLVKRPGMPDLNVYVCRTGDVEQEPAD